MNDEGNHVVSFTLSCDCIKELQLFIVTSISPNAKGGKVVFFLRRGAAVSSLPMTFALEHGNIFP